MVLISSAAIHFWPFMTKLCGGSWVSFWSEDHTVKPAPPSNLTVRWNLKVTSWLLARRINCQLPSDTSCKNRIRDSRRETRELRTMLTSNSRRDSWMTVLVFNVAFPTSCVPHWLYCGLTSCWKSLHRVSRISAGYQEKFDQKPTLLLLLTSRTNLPSGSASAISISPLVDLCVFSSDCSDSMTSLDSIIVRFLLPPPIPKPRLAGVDSAPPLPRARLTTERGVKFNLKTDKPEVIAQLPYAACFSMRISQMRISLKCGYLSNADISQIRISLKYGYLSNADISQMRISLKCGYLSNADFSQMRISLKCGSLTFPPQTQAVCGKQRSRYQAPL